MSDPGHLRPAAFTVLVVGANGGSGASLVAGALALVWTRAGSVAWLIELDVERGDLGDAWSLPCDRTLADLAGVVGEVDAVHLGHVAHPSPGGPQVLLAPSSPGAVGVWDAEAIARLLTAARTAAGDRGRVVIDGGVGLSGPSLIAARHADGIVVVCSPRVSAARRARRLIEALVASGADARCGLVVSDGPDEAQIGARALGRAVGAPIIGELPWAPREGRHLSAGRWPTGRRARLAAAITSLAEAIG